MRSRRLSGGLNGRRRQGGLDSRRKDGWLDGRRQNGCLDDGEESGALQQGRNVSRDEPYAKALTGSNYTCSAQGRRGGLRSRRHAVIAAIRSCTRSRYPWRRRWHPSSGLGSISWRHRWAPGFRVAHTRHAQGHRGFDSDGQDHGEQEATPYFGARTPPWMGRRPPRYLSYPLQVQTLDPAPPFLVAGGRLRRARPLAATAQGRYPVPSALQPISHPFGGWFLGCRNSRGDWTSTGVRSAARGRRPRCGPRRSSVPFRGCVQRAWRRRGNGDSRIVSGDSHIAGTARRRRRAEGAGMGKNQGAPRVLQGAPRRPDRHADGRRLVAGAFGTSWILPLGRVVALGALDALLGGFPNPCRIEVGPVVRVCIHAGGAEKIHDL